MQLKTAVSFLLSASLMAGCSNKSMRDAEDKRCRFVLHDDFHTQRADIADPRVYRDNAFSAKIVYRHNHIKGRSLEVFAQDRNGDREITLNEVTRYSLMQTCDSSTVVDIQSYERADNRRHHFVYDYERDNVISSQFAWGGMDGRPGDPMMEFINPQSRHYMKRDTVSADVDGKLKTAKSPYMN